MADLGGLITLLSPRVNVQKTGVWWANTTTAIPGGTLPVAGVCVAKNIPLDFGLPSTSLAIDTTGVLSGQVLDGTTPIAGAEVWVFHRGTKLPAARTFSIASGFFSVSGLGKMSKAYFAVAFGPDGTSYGASIFDTLTPV